MPLRVVPRTVAKMAVNIQFVLLWTSILGIGYLVRATARFSTDEMTAWTPIFYLIAFLCGVFGVAALYAHYYQRHNAMIISMVPLFLGYILFFISYASVLAQPITTPSVLECTGAFFLTIVSVLSMTVAIIDSLKAARLQEAAEVFQFELNALTREEQESWKRLRDGTNREDN